MAIFARKLMAHVRHDGKSFDIPIEELRVSAAAPDVEVHSALSRHFDVAPSSFDRFVVERHPTGNLTVRPEAVFG